MGKKIKGFTITLDDDYSEEQMERLMTAFYMHQGVVHVEPSLTTSNDHMNRQMIKFEIQKKYYDWIY